MSDIENYQNVRRLLAESRKLDFAEAFQASKVCSALLGQKDTEHYGRDLVIRGLDAMKRFPDQIKRVWNDIVCAAGLFPYVDSSTLSQADALRHEYHESAFLGGFYLHREQQELAAQLVEGKSLILSAPTSFGKSLLIEEVVASRRYNNIVVIQPTLALLDETRKKLSKYSNDYQLTVSTHQSPGGGRNLFLFTAERVVEYDKLPRVDFFVIDEFYKLSMERDDERAIVLNQALYKLRNYNSRFYLLGPNIKSISPQLQDEKDVIWLRSDFATVAVDVEKVYEGKQWTTHDDRREKELFRILLQVKEPTLIYCASPKKTIELAGAFAKLLKLSKRVDGWKELGVKNRDVIEWIKENIHDEWALAASLEYGVAVHHGHLPRHLGSSIVEAFNNRSVQLLFCTSTLIEGVNTAARNVILFDRHKGRKPIDFFDYKNIVGRSGRMKIHYVGRVVEFHREPAQSELEVDIPLFSQDNAPLELLVQLKPEDLQSGVEHRLQTVRALDPALQAIIKKNSGIPVLGQIQFVRELEEKSEELHPFLSWSTIPNYEQLKTTLDLCWRFLMRNTESKAGVMSHKQLAVLTLQYCSYRSLQVVIAMALGGEYWRGRIADDYERVQYIVGLVLGASRQWFDYKLPKLLSAATELQAYVFRKSGLRPGNYYYLSTLLENSFFKGVLSVLLDYDVPASAVRKLESQFRPEDDWATVRRKLSTLPYERFGLLPYEIRKLKAALEVEADRRG
jgi:late competence protein required for DNA uptake (superfamily II DNA/RNA helicase)